MSVRATHKMPCGAWATLLLVMAIFIAPDLRAEEQEAVKSYAPYPEPGSGYVTDLADLLTDEQEEGIEQRLWATEEQTGVEIVVVLIESMADYPDAPQGGVEQFARGLFDTYGIGNLPTNDGVLLLVARADRKARIELGKHYGLKYDREARQIMQSKIVPAFKKGDYARGVTDGVNALMLEFAGVRHGANWPLFRAIGFMICCVMIAGSLAMSGKRGWGWVVVGSILVLVLAILRSMHYIATNLPESSGGGGSSGWSSGGYGGGFGGGSSGGGGATGSW